MNNIEIIKISIVAIINISILSTKLYNINER